MKKWIFLGVLACSGVGGVCAQDMIIRTNGVRIEARVTEVSTETVRYKRFSNPDGPTYVLPVAEVRSILYPNGERDDFGTSITAATEGNASASEPSAVQPTAAVLPVSSAAERGAHSTAPATIVAVTASSTSEMPVTSAMEGGAASAAPATFGRPVEGVVLRYNYAVGDYYDNGAVRGVVCEVTDGGTHGLILSLEQANLPWSALPKEQNAQTGAVSANDGEANMRAIERLIADRGLSWADFPAFEWCRDQGTGWYLPSIDELLRICANYNGGSRTSFNREARKRFNDALQGHGGRRLDRLAYYLSSTERDAGAVICSHVDLTPPFVGDIPKHTRFFVRAVHKF